MGSAEVQGQLCHCSQALSLTAGSPPVCQAAACSVPDPAPPTPSFIFSSFWVKCVYLVLGWGALDSAALLYTNVKGNQKRDMGFSPRSGALDSCFQLVLTSSYFKSIFPSACPWTPSTSTSLLKSASIMRLFHISVRNRMYLSIRTYIYILIHIHTYMPGAFLVAQE